MPETIKDRISGILRFAIDSERIAFELYSKLAARSRDGSVKQLLSSLAEQEKAHRAKLEEVLAGKIALEAKPSALDRVSTDPVVEPPVKLESMDVQEALRFAMRRETASCRLYKNLAAATQTPEAKSLLTALAGEEAEHKLRLEKQLEELARP
ncbi:MAG: ferritin family protein [Elusimicrobia bacterium]|nr:ferritin family protein [Elusimicrobiota bacterium]